MDKPKVDLELELAQAVKDMADITGTDGLDTSTIIFG